MGILWFHRCQVTVANQIKTCLESHPSRAPSVLGGGLMKRSGELFPLAALHCSSNAAMTAQSRSGDQTHGGKKELKMWTRSWHWKNLKEMVFSEECRFLKYKVAFDFKPFSVPFEVNSLLQKCQQLSFLALLKGLGTFFFFLNLLNIFRRKCRARKSLQTSEKIAKCLITKWSISGFPLLPFFKTWILSFLKILSFSIFFCSRNFHLWSVVGSQAKVPCGLLTETVGRQWNGKSLN